MELYKRKAVIIAKIETVYGTDSVPLGANAIGVTDLKVEPAKGTKKKREIYYPDFSTQPHIITQQHQAVSFTVELKGGGAAGTVPECGVLLRSCMMSETISAGVDVAYQPVSEDFESCSIYVNQDGILHKLPGFRGTVKFNVNGGDYPTAFFSGLALAVSPADVAPVVPVYTSVVPVEVNEVNTTFTFGGFAAVLHSLEVDLGVSTKFRELPNQEAAIMITGRDCKGSLTMDAIKNADHNFWADWAAATPLVLAMAHGTVAGNIVEIDAPKAQMDSVDYGDADNILTFNQPLAFTRDAGDDEVVITFR
jgi:hypothetical protein